MSSWTVPQVDAALLHSKVHNAVATCVAKFASQCIMFLFILFKAKTWIETFLSMSSVVQGYQRRNITPYMHILAYHVPEMVRNNGNIKQFSRQGKPYLNYAWFSDLLNFFAY